MNKFDKYYDFRIATINDVDAIMKFIKTQWNEKHILAHDKELFMWQYGNLEKGEHEKINFVLMLNKEGVLMGISGFIPYSDECDELHISLAITKVRSEGNLPMSGVELLKRQSQILEEKINFAYGTNPKTILPVFKKVFHQQVGIMQQYYMLNPWIDNFKIAKVIEKNIEQYVKTDYRLIEIHSLSEIDGRFDYRKKHDRMVYKSEVFLNKRYFQHPIYIYKKWIILNNKKVEGILFGREIDLNGSKILRLVDYRGDLSHLYNIGNELHRLLYEHGYEYIDLVVSTLPKDLMKLSGFSLLDPDGKNIIPHYFEPFIQENIKVYYQKSADIVIFKADGDQDRPNIWKEDI